MPSAELIYDGDELARPAAARDDQMQGTVAERLAELAGRECYDSLGKGRGSADYHKHILEVGHLSVLEHFNFTVELPLSGENVSSFLNRPGTFVSIENGIFHVTLNLRCVLDWGKWNNQGFNAVFLALAYYARELAPQIFPVLQATDGTILTRKPLNTALVKPDHTEAEWVSLRLVGSRGFSHEMVRHRFRTAVSQRSTRYVDESTSPWCLHPLVLEFIKQENPSMGISDTAYLCMKGAKEAYDQSVVLLEPWLIEKGVDKATARKQARGAARGFLGNALQTSMIYSASIAQWRRILALRCHPAADAEIRMIMADALRCLKASRYSGRFEDLNLVPSPDGIGEVLAP
jgi:thymidylate synthase ThyX